MLGDCPRLYRLLLRLDVFDHLYEKDEYQLGRYWQLLLDTDEERFTPCEYLNAPGVADASRANSYCNQSLFFCKIVVRLTSSLALAEASLSIRKEISGEDNSDTATTYNNIGIVYAYLGDYDKALEYYNKALSILQKILGEEHPDTAMSYNNIGTVYAYLGDYDKALEYYNKALSIRQKVLGEEHPDTAMSYNNMGSVYDELGDYDKALEYYDKALSIRQKVLGEEHPDTATSYIRRGAPRHSNVLQ